MISQWYQDHATRFMALTILYQTIGVNSLSVARYTNSKGSGGSWKEESQSLPIADGSALAWAPVASSGGEMRLYLGSTDGKMKQYAFDTESGSIDTESVTGESPRSGNFVCGRHYIVSRSRFR